MNRTQSYPLRDQQVVLTVLHQKFPEVALQIDAHLASLLPERVFGDYSLIPALLRTYCAIRAIEPFSIQGNLFNRPEAVHMRREFVALLLLLYQPEKIYGFSRKKVRDGMAQTIIQNLHCNRTYLSQDVATIVVRFKYYQDFKSDLLALHAEILAKTT